MAYNQNIPGANDLLSQSQSEIQENFSQIKTVIDINHITFGDANQGKHLYLQLPEHAAPTTAVNEGGLYANVGTTSTVTELFFRRENNGELIPMTERATGGAPGWTYLPSGIMLQWGSANLIGADAAGTTVAFVRSFPAACLNVQLTIVTTVGGQSRVAYVVTGSLTAANFKAAAKNSTSNNRNDATVYYLATGV